MNVFFKCLGYKAPFFNNLIVRLNETCNVERVGAIISGSADAKLNRGFGGRDAVEFLNEESDMNYEPLLYQQDLHRQFLKSRFGLQSLPKIEREYSPPNLRFYYNQNRNYGDLTEIEKKELVGKWFNLYEDILHEMNPDLFITADMGSPLSIIPFRITEKLGGTSLWWHTTRIGDLWSMKLNPFDDFEQIDHKYKLYSNDRSRIASETKGQVSQFLTEIRNNNVGAPNSSLFSLNSSGFREDSSKSLVRKGLEYWYWYHMEDGKYDYKQPSPYRKTQSHITNTYRSLKSARLGRNEQDLADSQNYIYFPLHYQPEWSTTILAPTYSNQLEIIKHIQKSLPIDQVLFVKEHPQMVKRGYRSLSFYQKIENMPDVHLINHRINSQHLIENSEMTITITGTAGLEAAIQGVPSVVLGEPHYRKIDLVNTCEIQELSTTLPSTSGQELSEDDSDLKAYLSAVIDESFILDKNSNHPSEEFINSLLKVIGCEP